MQHLRIFLPSKSPVILFIVALAIASFSVSPSLARDQLTNLGLSEAEIIGLIDQLDRINMEWSEDAVSTLIKHGSEPLVHELLVENLESLREFRFHAKANLLWILFRIEESPRPRLDALLELLYEPGNCAMEDGFVSAATAMQRLNIDTDQEYIDLIYEHLLETDPQWQGHLLLVLGAYRDDPRITEFLIDSVFREDRHNSSWTMIGYVIDVLESNTNLKEDEALLDRFLETLKDGPDGARQDIAKILIAYGSNESVISSLFQSVNEDRHLNVRIYAIETLAQLVSKSEIFPTVLDLLWSQDVRDNIVALKAIKEIGNALDIVEGICRIIESGRLHNIYDEECPYVALQAIGEDACDAVPILIKVIESRRGNYIDAVITLKSIGPCAADAVPALLDVLESADKQAPGYRYIVEKVFDTISSFGSLASHASPAIIELIDPDDQYQRWYALEALGKIGGDPSIITPKLLEMAISPSSEEDRNVVFTLNELAINTLSNFKDQDDEIIPVLLTLLEQNPDSRLAIHLHLALFKLGYEPELHRQEILDSLYILEFDYDGVNMQIYNYDESYNDKLWILEHAMWACGELGQDAIEELDRIRLWVELAPRSSMLLDDSSPDSKIIANIGF